MKFKYWIIGLVICIGVAFCFISCEAEDSVAEIMYTKLNPFEKLEITFTGIDTYGKVELDVSGCDEFTKDNIEFVYDSVSVRNGDVITVTAIYDTTRAEDQLYKITVDTTEYIVSGLQEIQYIDPFAGLEITYSGKSMDGVAQLDTSSCTDEIKEYISYTYSDKLTNGDSIKINAMLDEGVTAEHGIALLVTEKEYTVSGLIEPLHMQFDKKQFVDVMNEFIDTDSWFDEIKGMNEYIIADITFDGMPEFIVGSYGSGSGGIWVYDLTQMYPKEVGSNETKSPELHRYVNKTTGKPVCTITENSRFGKDSWKWTSEILSYKGKLYSDHNNQIPTKSLHSISVIYDETGTKEEIKYGISGGINVQLTDIEILERIIGLDNAPSVIGLYTNTSMTKNEYDAALKEYYDNLYELQLPYVNPGYQSRLEEDEVRALLKEMVNTYIESCEEIAKTENEWFVLEIIND